MAKCVNKSHPEFQALLKDSGINPTLLAAKVGVWMEENNTDNFPTLSDLNLNDNVNNNNSVNYLLKGVDILLSDRAKQIFDKAGKAKWDINKLLTELQIPKEQRELLVSIANDFAKNGNSIYTLREQLAIELASKYSYSVEVNTTKVPEITNIDDGVGGLVTRVNPNGNPTSYYSNLTVPGGTNYTENEISTPLITPSIKGHAQFSTDNGIGWFRSDDRSINADYSVPSHLSEMGIEPEPIQGELTKTRRILEVQSDLFQKGRDREDLINNTDKVKLIKFLKNEEKYLQQLNNELEEIKRLKENDLIESKLSDIKQQENIVRINKQNIDNFERFKKLSDNQFLQLLNKDNNWVTFFIKSIIQNSAKKGYEKVLFPKGETAAKIEGHETIADEIKKIDSVISNFNEIGKKAIDIDTASKIDYDVTESKEQILARLNDYRNSLKSQGVEKLKPIEAFYEIKVGNILEKQFGKDNVKTITDEYGNQWREITITPEIKEEPIYLQKDSDVFGNSINYTEETEALVNSQTVKLQKLFDNLGISVNVVANPNISESARVNTIDNRVIIEFNPSKLRDDSIFHEFGHILVDIVDDPEFIQRGIQQLYDTKLWKDIANLYSDKSEEALGKEVLTTAIGLNARDQFEKQNDSEWKFWWNRLLDRIIIKLKQFFGVSPVERKEYSTEVAVTLAKALTTGDIKFRINNKLQIHNNQLRDTVAIRFLKQTENYLTSRKNMYTRIFQKYGTAVHSSTYFARIEESLNELDLINNVNENNLTEVFSVVTKTMTNDLLDLSALEKRLDYLESEYLNKDVKLKDLSEQDFIKFNESLYGASMFINNYVPVKSFGTLKPSDLESIPEEDRAKYEEISNFIFEKQEEMLPRIARLENTYKNLVPLVSEWILGYSTNPKIANHIAEFLQDSDNKDFDETKLQLMFDSAIYSNNAMVANMAKIVHLHQGLSENETTELLKKYWKAANTLTIDSKELGKILFDKNGQIIKKYDTIRFNDDLDAYLAKYKKNTRAYENARINFYNENTEFKINPKTKVAYTKEEINTIIAEKRSTLSAPAYERWFDKQFNYAYKDKKRGYYKLSSDFVIPISKYRSDDYLKIQNNTELANYYNAVKDILEYCTTLLSDSPQGQGFLPNIVESARDYGAEHEETIEMIDELGNVQYILPMRYLGFASAKKTYKFRPRRTGDNEESFEDYEKWVLKRLVQTRQAEEGEFKTLAEVHQKNREIRIQNKEGHGLAVSRDLHKVIPMFVEAATQHKQRSVIEDALLIQLAELKKTKLLKLDYRGRIIKNTARSLDNERQDATFDAAESNAYKHAKDFIKMVFYDRYVDKKKGDTALKFLKEYSSILGMGFNIFAAVKNVTYGGYMTTAESIAGLHFSKEDLDKAGRRYLAAVPGFIADTSRKDSMSSSSLDNALVKRFQVIESYDELFELQDAELSRKYAKKFFIDAAFFMQHQGEHMMHNTTLFAMLESHRLVNGKAMSFQDYLRGKKKVVSLRDVGNKDLADAIIEENKQIEATAQEEFDKFVQLKDIYELDEDGYSKIKDEYKDQFSEADEILFREEVKSVNHKIHGIYNKSHKGTVNQSMLWQSILQFRNWVRPGWNKRFGTRGGVFTDQPFWNENRNEIDTGTYTSLWKFLTRPVTKNNKEYWSSDQERTTWLAIQNIIKDYGDWLVNMKYYWHTLNDSEKAAAKSALTEIAFLALLTGLSIVLRGIRDDDDKLKKNKAYNFLLYQISANITELWTYIPGYGWAMEASKVLSNPNASYGVMVNTMKLVSNVFAYPFVDDEKRYFQGGMNKDRLKIGVYAKRNLPVLNVWQRLLQLDSQSKAYNMFGAIK